MSWFKRKKKVRRTESTYTATQMYNDHNASLAMFALLQPTAIVDPVEQQREADEKFDADNAVDDSPIEIAPDPHVAQAEHAESVQDSTPAYEAPVESDSSSSYDSGSSYSSSYDSSSSSSYDSGSSYSDGGSSYSDSGSSF